MLHEKVFLKLVYSLQLVLQSAHDMEEKWERLSEFLYTPNLHYYMYNVYEWEIQP